MTIINIKNAYRVVSEHTSKNLGTYNYKTPQGKKIAHTLAVKRLKQVEFFKHRRV